MNIRHHYRSIAAIGVLVVLSLPLVGLLIDRVEAGKPFRRAAARRNHGTSGFPSYDRPFPLGQVSDSFWETQQTNAEAADFIFHDHEFRGDSALLTPAAKRHLEQVAVRLEHVPFVVVIERSDSEWHPALDSVRRRSIVESLARMGVVNANSRVVVAESFAPGMSAIEAEQAYQQSLSGQRGTGQTGRLGGARFR